MWIITHFREVLSDVSCHKLDGSLMKHEAGSLIPKLYSIAKNKRYENEYIFFSTACCDVALYRHTIQAFKLKLAWGQYLKKSRRKLGQEKSGLLDKSKATL